MAKSYGLLFPGQGSQFTRMGESFFDLDNDFKDKVEEVNDIAKFDLLKLIMDGPKEQLDQTQFTQPALYFVSSIIYDRIMLSGKVDLSLVAGHSVGEVAAAYGSGSISFEDGLRFVIKRGELMSKATPPQFGSMAAIIGLTADKIDSAIKEFDQGISIANYNSPLQSVVAGERGKIEEFGRKIKELGAKKYVLLPVSGPFHTKFMNKAKEELKEFVDSIEFKEPKVKLLRNLDAKLVESGDKIKEGLIEQISSPVLWSDSILKLSSMNVKSLIEVGPGKTLAALAKRTDSSLEVISINDVTDLGRI
ncbi:MAG: ACP S-malonyltransferase [Nitrospinota bacterium]